jgi:hypothetical protein
VRKEELKWDKRVRGKGRQVVGVGFGENVKWPDCKGRFRSFGGKRLGVGVV